MVQMLGPMQAISDCQVTEGQNEHIMSEDVSSQEGSAVESVIDQSKILGEGSCQDGCYYNNGGEKMSRDCRLSADVVMVRASATF